MEHSLLKSQLHRIRDLTRSSHGRGEAHSPAKVLEELNVDPSPSVSRLRLVPGEHGARYGGAAVTDGLIIMHAVLVPEVHDPAIG